VAGALLILGGASMVGRGDGGRPDAGPSGPPATSARVSTPAVPAIAGDADAGWERYIESCAACHGPEGNGMPNQGVSLRASRFLSDHTDAELFAFLKAGRLPTDPASVTRMLMPPKGGNAALTDAQLRDVVAHLRTIQQAKPAAPSGAGLSAMN
jgi:disulfide bond formation protein DsbB